MQAASWTWTKILSFLQAEIKVLGFESVFTDHLGSVKPIYPKPANSVGQHEEMRFWMLLADKQE